MKKRKAPAAENLEHNTTLRLPDSFIDRADALIEVQRIASGGIYTVNRSTILRLAVLRGLEVLESTP